MAKPIIKWVGGKSRLIKYIEPLLPKKYNRYIEPFLGGGALLFHLKPEKAIVNDINSELINLYKTIRDSKEEYLEKLTEFKKLETEDFFYEIRSWDRLNNFTSRFSNIERAARFTFLNKTGYGGLYRVNSKGKFNVPYAKVINGKKIVDIENTNKVASILQNTKILNGDYKNVMTMAKKGDLVFIDPPYLPLPGKDSFTSYDKSGFNEQNHIELAELINKLTKKGVYIVATNHATKQVKTIYSKLKFYKIPVTRTVSSKSETKSGYFEFIMTNF